MPNSSPVTIHTLDAVDFCGRGTKRGNKMLQEVRDFMIIDTVVAKAPTDEFGVSDLDPGELDKQLS